MKKKTSEHQLCLIGYYDRLDDIKNCNYIYYKDN